MVKIKPLVWVESEELACVWDAEVPFGFFWVSLECDETFEAYTMEEHKNFPTEAEAKAWCQSEYERRVLECLE